MPDDQHDAPPPAEAMTHLMRVLPPLETGMALAGIKTLPAAARWRLIAWLAKGLEPTRGMRRALRDTVGDFAPSMDFIIAEIIAAAAEAGDEPA